jgi:thiamine pyrophosphokinase
MGTDCGNSVDLFDARLCSVSIANTNIQRFCMIVSTQNSVTLLGASAVSVEDIEEILPFAPILVAADGGAETAMATGRTPDAVIGDFDSLPQLVRETIPIDRIHPIAEQETTDFEKCLSRIDAPLILAIGFAGRRLDHELAVYNALVRHPERRCIVIGSHDVAFHAPRTLVMDLPEGSRLSLFPMAGVEGRSAGLRWPIDGIRFAPDGRIGTSNEVIGPVRLGFEGDGMLVIVPRAALAVAIAALTPG